MLLLAAACHPGLALAKSLLTGLERQWLEDNGDKLVLWYDRKFPPIEFQAPDGSFSGIGAEVMALIQDRMGVRFVTEPAGSWPEQLDALKSGEAPITPVIVRAAEREEYALFSKPYLIVPVVVITTKDRAGARGLHDFHGQRVAVVQGYVSETYLRDNYQGKFEIVPVHNIQEGLRDVSFGVVDALVENLAVAAHYMDQEKLPNLRVAGGTGLTYELGFAVSKKYPLLFGAMQKAFADISEEELEAIRERWIPLAGSSGLSRGQWRVFQAVLFFALALLAGLFVITWFLKRRLRGKEEAIAAAGHELQEKNERLKLAMKATSAGIWDLHPHTGKTSYSTEWHTMLGYEPGEVPSDYEAWSSLIHPEDLAAVKAILAEYMQGGGRGSFEAEFRMRAKSGEWRWLLGKGQAVEWDGAGRPTRIMGMNVDIQTIKESQAALRQSEALSKAMFDQAFNFFGLLDLEGRILRINKAALDVFGRDMNQVRGKYFWEGPWWSDQEEAKILCAEAIGVALGGNLFRREARHVKNDGEEIIIDFSMTPLRGENGEIAYLIPEGRDITEIHNAQKAAEESERRFKTIFDNAPYSITISRRKDGRLLDVNNSFVRNWGGDKALALQQKTAAISGISDEEAAVFRSSVTGQGIHNVERRIVDSGGAERHILFSAVPIAYGGEDAILAIVVDITDKKKAELALAESEKKYRDIFNNAPIGIFRSAVQGHFVEANPAMARMFRYESAEDMIRSVKNIAEDIYPTPRARQVLLKALEASPGGVSREIEFKRKDGTPMFGIIHATMQKDEQGEYAFMDGTIEDITQRKKSEQALRASEEKFSRLFHLSPDAIALLQKNGGVRVMDVNDVFVEMFGTPKAELLGMDFSEMPLVANQARRAELLDKLVANKPVSNFEVPMSGKEGRELFCSLSCQRIELEGAPHVLAVFRDISETKAMQQMMVQTEKMLSIGGIAAGIAHEINNPLGIVLQASQNLAQRSRADFPKNIAVAESIGLDMNLMAEYMKARKLDVFIQDIRDAATRASLIIRHMLDFSRRSESRRSECKIGTIIDGAIALARSDFDLKKNYDFRKIEVRVEQDENVPVINCTETEIEQVLLNLLRNAAQAMAKAQPPIENPRISIRVMNRGKWVRIEVEDNGPGIPEELQNRIMEPFFTTKEPGVGTGLGLSVSYFIVTTGHDGKFSVSSEPGRGTCFVIELPTQETRGAKR